MIRFQSPSLRYISALVLPVAALIVAVLLRRVIDQSFFLPFVAAVFLSAWFHGLGAALLATLVSVLAADLVFIESPSSFTIESPQQAGRLLAFAVVCVLIAYLVSRRRAHARLLAAMLEGVAEGLIATDLKGRVCFINPAAEEITGWTRSAAMGKPASAILRLSDEKTRAALEDPLAKSLREGKVLALDSHVMLTPREGAETPIEASASPIRDADGKLLGAVMLFRDISRHRQVTDMASHSQKMEAVGRLASGVAGDFNNLLTVMTGYSELLRGELAPGNPLRRFADEIQLASERAAGLTRQLLAFSRGQAAQPRLLDINAVIANMDKMLRRLLGERIEVVILPAPALGRVKCDPGQIEQIVVNLAMNPRDAMPDGGKFVVETASIDLEEGEESRRIGVEPGAYVMIAVSDTGCGMDAETRSRLFEPFFTTKRQGKRTGLGLSIVYGIVKQNHGQITVYSQPGSGTIFEIYLPRSREPAEAPPRGKPARPGRGSETILLVEDEDGVRKLCSAVLQSNGYMVLEAADGVAGLALYEENSGQIDLLLTDIVMPRMNGFELAERVGAKDARLSILYMSGYRDNPVSPSGKDANWAFLHKPFTPDALLVKVRESLDARVNGAHS
jgi:two-component system, cell cycle sensor histidine kinase and response regulator CckA